MLNIFDGYLDNIYYQKNDFAYFFEYYLHYSKTCDRKIFECLKFEDDMGIGRHVNIVNVWNDELTSNSNCASSRKAVTYKTSLVKRIVDKLLPFSSKRRSFVKKVYYKFKRR
jgi:hypothetical protein